MKTSISLLEHLLPKLKQNFSLASLNYIEFQVVLFNEELSKCIKDYAFYELSDATEEELDSMDELIDFIFDNCLKEHCVPWKETSRKIGLVWSILVDFEDSEITIAASEKTIKSRKLEEHSLTLKGDTEIYIAHA